MPSPGNTDQRSDPSTNLNNHSTDPAEEPGLSNPVFNSDPLQQNDSPPILYTGSYFDPNVVLANTTFDPKYQFTDYQGSTQLYETQSQQQQDFAQYTNDYLDPSAFLIPPHQWDQDYLPQTDSYVNDPGAIQPRFPALTEPLPPPLYGNDQLHRPRAQPAYSEIPESIPTQASYKSTIPDTLTPPQLPYPARSTSTYLSSPSTPDAPSTANTPSYFARPFPGATHPDISSLHYTADMDPVDALSERLGEFLFSPDATIVNTKPVPKKHDDLKRSDDGALIRNHVEYDGLTDVARNLL